MKKKLMLALLVVAALFCMIAITASAEAPAYDRTYNVDDVEYPIWEQDSEGNYHPLIWYLNNENEMCKVWADNQDTTKAPYVTYACYITSDSDAEIGTIRIYDESGTEYLTREKAVIANLNGVQITYNGRTSYIQRINENAFKQSSLIKAAFLPTENFEYAYYVTDSDGKFYYNTSAAGHSSTIKKLQASGKWIYELY